MKKKNLAYLLCSAMMLTATAGFTAGAEETETEAVVEAESAGETEDEQSAEEAQDADFLSKIQGSYIELFPEMAKEEYRDIWLEETGAIVGEDKAEETTDMLLGMCMAEIYGQEAIDAYAEDPDSMAFDCYFLGGVSEFTVDGDTISGVDEEGNEVFSHTYDYLETDENGFYLYQSEDADAGQFTYFAFAPDTMDEIWHLEFRYSEDLSDLASWYEGAYAYWNVGAIAADYDAEDMENAIHLFATENLE